MFRYFKSLKRENQIIFGLIIFIALILFWRGAWMLINMILFPKNDILSASISVILGFTILVATDYIVKQAQN